MNTFISYDTRADFNESWLSESPEMIPATDLVDMLDYNIKELSQLKTVISLGDNYFKIDGETTYYWFQENGKILLAAEFSKKPQTLVVNGIGKRNRGKPPFASDLYAMVLRDHKTIRIMSDIQLSEEGFAVWAKLLAAGFIVSVYDSKNPGQSHKQIKSADELKQYLKADDTEFKRYQYVVSENMQLFAECKAVFNTKRMRELSGIL